MFLRENKLVLKFEYQVKEIFFKCNISFQREIYLRLKDLVVDGRKFFFFG